MTEKTVSKYLLNLEKHFTSDNSVLVKATKIFHDLDQLEYDLNLLEAEDTTASRSSWWPIVSLIGGNSTAKSKFINNYLGTEQLAATGIQTSAHKFTVLLHNNQPNAVTLPGTALDVDHRYPFYQISQKIEQRQKGEGVRINAHLELKTLHSDRLKGKLFVDAPNMGASQLNPIDSLLTAHIIEHSDLVLVFTDVFDTLTPLVNELIQLIIAHQDTNKFVFVVEQAAGFTTPANSQDLIAAAQRRLFDLGINEGQFIGFSSQATVADFAEIEQRMENVGHDRTYRILNTLEKSIHDLEEVAVAEVRKDLIVWKDRCNMSTSIILGFIIFLAILMEINMGLLDILLDPIIGSISIVVLVIVMVPLHLLISRLQARLIISRLAVRQKQLNIAENLANFFEKNLTIGRMLLPVTEPAGWNKKTKNRMAQLLDRTKDLVQSLNDDFGSYDEQSLKDYLDSIK
jgi:hypothetical protein